VDGSLTVFLSLVRSSLRHYRLLHTLVVSGVAVAVAVLAGALLVGTSVRGSLRDLALSRLGAADVVVSSTTFFREALADDIRTSEVGAVVPLLTLTGVVTHEENRRTAARVQVFGIDDRFLQFHGRTRGAPTGREAWMSAGLATELGVTTGDSILLRIAKATDIPLSHVQGRRDEVSERIRLTVTRLLDRTALGEFSLVPAQGPALSLFVPLARLQQDLDLEASVNALLIDILASADAERDVTTTRAAVKAAARLGDLGLKVRANRNGTISILESRSGLLPDSVAQATWKAAVESGRASVGALTYLANSIRARGREIPYSLITAVDLDAYDSLMATTASSPKVGGATKPLSNTPHPPIRLNEWAEADLGVTPGDPIEIDYYLWSDEHGVETRTAMFTFVGVVPMSGAGGDQTLTPEYPGITDARDVTSWDPPFPVNMKRVRPKDEDYWDDWRSAPKAFIPLVIGQRLWPSAFGTLSSLRTAPSAAEWPPIDAIDVFSSGLTVKHARAEALAAADGTTDFAEYFVYFSFFIVVSGLLLAGLFFALTVEQRAKELGLLLAVGYRHQDVRRVLGAEAGVLAAIGAVIGAAGAIGYAAIIMHGLRTWWVDAVNTTALELHVDPVLLLAGAGAAFVSAMMALLLSMRRLTHRSARTLLVAGLSEERSAWTPARRRSRLARVIATVAVVTAGILIATAVLGRLNEVAAFFGAGGLLMIAGAGWFASWLRRSGGGHSGRTSVFRFGAGYARWRPARSVLSAALIAFACFVIVAVGAFRKDSTGTSLTHESGTGGFALIAESVAPLMHNPNTAQGREELSISGYPEVEGAHVARFRLRPGDEASCLTLYQPRNPRIIAPETAFLGDARFSFAQSLADTDEERSNPWLLLNRQFDDGAVPAIADQTTLAYVFHLRVGDDFVFTSEGGQPVRLRIVAALADSVLQSELIIGEAQFVALFPRHEGYRVWFIEAPNTTLPALTNVLEDRLSDFGVDVTDTRARLAAYHRVENTYLSTFQALGALGLLIGTLGLAAVLARNVLERRRELGLLAAVGFTSRHLTTMVTAESLLLAVTGIAIGTIAALVAISPSIAARSSPVPFGYLGILLAAVLATSLFSSVVAVRFARSVGLVEAIKDE